MKTVRKHWKSPLLCAALILALLLTACGGSSSSGENAGSTGNPGSAGTETGVSGEDTAGNGNDSAGAGGVIYDANDIEIILTDVTEAENYDSLDFEITNKGSKTLQVQLYPLVINNTISFSDGVFNDIEPGETIPGSVFLDLTSLKYVGISSIGAIDGYIVINDPDNHYEPIAEPERITIMKGASEASASDLAHSDQIIFDSDGICISCLGTYEGEDIGSQTILLVTNNTEDVVNIGTPYQEEIIDGKPAEDRRLDFNGATIMPGDCAMITVSVHDSETYEPAVFNTLDLDKKASSYRLEMPADELYLNDPLVEEGHEDSNTILGRCPANLTGTLVNDGDAAKMAYIIYTLYDKDGEIILAGKRLESCSGRTEGLTRFSIFPGASPNEVDSLLVCSFYSGYLPGLLTRLVIGHIDELRRHISVFFYFC